MKRLLGIETSGQTGSVAFVEGERVVHFARLSEANRHAEETLPQIERALAELGWDKSSLDAVAVGRGPGSFTGLRVGLAVASGLRLGLGLRTFGFGSLRVAAACACIDGQGSLVRGAPGERLVVIRDARREEVFAGLYDEAWAELEPARTWPKAQVGENVAAWVGDQPHRQVTEEPDARGAALLGALALAASAGRADTESDELESLTPEYVRDAGATPQVLLTSPLLDPRR
ncbi:MAG TPA: tRNA (adenosine(37)-N6)-threonylcarbamoyltransferase complex dimerization subunit type 1 TsaB [Polyangiaceae bacterium]|nr:tRNA (adenosine(37)-N6)-threonylcarbamoyltransferase complex dimerization subunit type 1 TsaB [Polyangiaceae bacterium]